MATVAISSWYPVTKLAEVGAVFTKQQQNRPLIPFKLSGPYNWSTRDGVETFAAYEVANAKLYDFLLVLSMRMMEYHGIEGYRYELRVVGSPSEIAAGQRRFDELQKKK